MSMRNVSERLDDLRAESVSLNAENLALQTLLFSLMISLHRSRAVPPEVFSRTFEVASQYLSSLAMRQDGADSKTATGEHGTLAALRIVEDFRAEFEGSR
jgi:hypothetical protein